jgi:hypothetical protein
VSISLASYSLGKVGRSCVCGLERGLRLRQPALARRLDHRGEVEVDLGPLRDHLVEVVQFVASHDPRRSSEEAQS